MKALIVGLLVLVLGFSVYGYLNSRKYKFFYFPETNMYYDVKKHQYIYSVDGGNTWAIMSRSTEEIPELLGEKVVIKSRDPNVWLLNPEHRRRYNGVLTDINAVMEHSGNYSAQTHKRKDADPNEQPHNDSLVKAKKEFFSEDSTSVPSMVMEEEDTVQSGPEASGVDSGVRKSLNKEVKAVRKKDSTESRQDSVELKESVVRH